MHALRKRLMAFGTIMWLDLVIRRVPAVQFSCCALTTQQSAIHQALGVSGSQRRGQSRHSPEAAPVCLQDMSICQDVRVEDMGHKQGCNGVDNGKLWFSRELCMLQMALSASLAGQLLQGHCQAAQVQDR